MARPLVLRGVLPLGSQRTAKVAARAILRSGARLGREPEQGLLTWEGD